MGKEKEESVSWSQYHASDGLFSFSIFPYLLWGERAQVFFTYYFDRTKHLTTVPSFPTHDAIAEKEDNEVKSLLGACRVPTATTTTGETEKDGRRRRGGKEALSSDFSSCFVGPVLGVSEEEGYGFQQKKLLSRLTLEQ